MGGSEEQQSSVCIIQALADEAWKDEAGAGAAVALNEFDTYDGSRKQPRHLRRRRSRRLLIC